MQEPSGVCVSLLWRWQQGANGDTQLELGGAAALQSLPKALPMGKAVGGKLLGWERLLVTTEQKHVNPSEEPKGIQDPLGVPCGAGIFGTKASGDP